MHSVHRASDSRAKYYEALWRSALRDGSMAADCIKGDVVVTFTWGHGPEDQIGRTVHSDEAERLTRDIGQAVVINALALEAGEASVTITVRRKR